MNRLDPNQVPASSAAQTAQKSEDKAKQTENKGGIGDTISGFWNGLFGKKGKTPEAAKSTEETTKVTNVTKHQTATTTQPADVTTNSTAATAQPTDANTNSTVATTQPAVATTQPTDATAQPPAATTQPTVATTQPAVASTNSNITTTTTSSNDKKAESPGWFERAAKSVASALIGKNDEMTEETTKTYYEKLRSITTPEQAQGLEKIVQALSEKLKGVVKAALGEKEVKEDSEMSVQEGSKSKETNSSELVKAMLEVNLLSILERYLEKIKGWDNSTSPEDLMLRVIEELIKDIRRPYEQKLVKLKKDLEAQLTELENKPLDPAKKTEEEKQIKDKYENDKIKLSEDIGDTILNILFPEGSKSIILPVSGILVKLKQPLMHWAFNNLINNAVQTLSHKTLEIKKSYQANLDTVQAFDKVNGSKLVELMKALTSRFNDFFKHLSAPAKGEASAKVKKDADDPLKPLLPKLSKIFTGVLSDDKDAASVEAVNFVGEYSNQVLMHIFARACQGSSGNQHILTSILEKLLSKTFKFGNTSHQQLKQAFAEYQKAKAEIKQKYQPEQPEYKEQLKEASTSMKANFNELVDDLMKELGVDSKGLQAILPHKFEGKLGFIQEKVGVDKMSPAMKVEENLRHFLTDFVFQIYRDVIVVQNQKPDFADKIVRYDESAKIVDELVAGLLPIIHGSLTDPESELGKLALSSINNILLGKFQADAKFFADPIRQLVQSDLMPQLEPYLQGYIRQAVTSLLAHVAMKQHPGEKVDLLADSIPYLLKICTDKIHGETIIPWLAKWKENYAIAQDLPESTEEQKTTKKNILSILTNSRAELFKKAAQAILNEGGWNNADNIPAPKIIKDSIKTLLADTILPDLLARIYTDTFVLDTVEQGSKTANVADDLMALATPSLNNFLNDNSFMLAAKLNQLLSFSQMNPASETLLGYELSQLLSPANASMQPIWKKIQQFMSRLTAQSLNRLASQHNGEAKDPVTKALLQLQATIQSQQFHPNLKEAILGYKAKVQQIKEMDESLTKLKKEAIALTSRFTDEQKALLPDLQKRLSSEGTTSAELAQRKREFIDQLRIPEEVETLDFERAAKFQELQNIEHQLNALAKTNSAYKQEKARLEGDKALRTQELHLLDSRLMALTGQNVVAQYDLSYYAVLLNEIEKQTIERRNKFIELHRDNALAEDTIQAKDSKADNILNKTLAILSEKDQDKYLSRMTALQLDLHQEQEGLKHLLTNVLLSPEMQSGYKAEFEDINNLLTILEKALTSKQPDEARQHLGLIVDRLMQKRQHLLKQKEQSSLVTAADEIDRQIKALKREAVKAFDAEQKEKLFKAIKSHHEASLLEMNDLLKEIDTLRRWLEVRKNIDSASEKPTAYDVHDTLKVQVRISELEKNLYKYKRYLLEYKPLLNLEPEAITSADGANKAWNDLTHILENKSNRVKLQLDGTTPLQPQYEEIIAPFKQISKQLFKDLGFEQHTKMPVPYFLQSPVWTSLMEGVLPSLLLDFYTCAWVPQTKTAEAEDVALADSSRSSAAASDRGSPLFATDKLADIATNQIKAVVAKPEDKIEKLAAVLKDSGLRSLDKTWLENLFTIITKDETLWSHIRDFVGNRLDYVITHLSEGHAGNAFLPVTIKSVLGSFKKHIKDKHQQVDLVINEYKSLEGDDKKAQFRKDSTIFHEFANEILTKAGLNIPEGFGLALFGPSILSSVKQQIINLCFDYCLSVSENKAGLSKLPKEFKERIKASDKSFSDEQAASLQSVYESLFSYIGETINDAVIKKLKGAKAPGAASGNQLIDLKIPFAERWEAKKVGEWIPKVERDNIILIRKEKGKKPEACETLPLEKITANEITPLVIYKAVCKHNSQKLAAEILDKLSAKCKEWKITLTPEFNAWFKQSLQLILEDDEVMKLLSNIPSWIKGILLKKMVQLTQQPDKTDGHQRPINVNQVPMYLVKSVLNVFQTKGPILKDKIHKVLKDKAYDYRKGDDQDKAVLTALYEDEAFKNEAKAMVAELLNLIKFDPKTDLPAIPMLKDMWDNAGPAAIEDMIINSHLNIAKIEFSRAQQKEEWDNLLQNNGLDEEDNKEIHHDLDKGVEFVGEKIHQGIHQFTGITPSKDNNTTLFADKIAKATMKSLIKTLKLNEPQGTAIFQNWMAQLIKQTLDDKQIRGMLDQIPQMVKDIIYKKLVQLADLTPKGEQKATHPGHLSANVSLVILDQIAQARQDFNHAYTTAIAKNPQATDEELIENLRTTSEQVVDNLFNNLKLAPKEDIPVLFVEEIWDNFGKGALADFISEMYVKTVKFYKQDNQTALEYVLNPKAFKEQKIQEKVAAAKRLNPLAASSSMSNLQQLDQSVDLNANQKTPVIQTEDARQVNNLLGVLGNAVRDQVKKFLQLMPSDEPAEPHKFAKDTLAQVFKAMGVQPDNISPVLAQWGMESIEKIVGSRQAGELIDEIPEKVKDVVLNKLVQLGRRKDLPLQVGKDESNFKHLPANIVIILLNAINESRPLLKPIMEIHLAAKVEIQKEHELQRIKIKNDWRDAKATLRHNFKDDPKAIERKLKAARNERNKRLSAAQIKFEAKSKENDNNVLTELQKVCEQILDDAFKKGALDINIAEDVPVPYADTLWNKFGKSTVAGMMAEAYLEMSKPQEEKAIHEHRLHAPVIEAAKKYAGYALDKLKNLMVFNTPGLDVGLQKLAEKLYGQGEKGKEVANYIENNKKAIETWFADNNLKKIAKSRDKGVNQALFSVVGEDLEAIMMQIFDNFTGNIKAIESQDPNFTYNFSMKLINIFTAHLKAVNAITKDTKKKYMYEVDAVTMQERMADQLHPDMPDAKQLKELHDLKTKNEQIQEVLAKLNQQPQQNAAKIAKLQEAISANQQRIAELQKSMDDKLKQGTYSKLAKYLLEMCNFTKPEDLPGPSLSVKKQMWDLLNGEFGADMVKTVCDNFLTQQKLNDYLLSLMQTINQKMEATLSETAPAPIKSKDSKIKLSPEEMKKNQEQCLELLKSLAGAFPNTLQAGVLNFAARFNMAPESLERVVRESLEEMPVSVMIEQALVSGAENLPKEKMPENQKEFDAAKKTADAQAKAVPGKIQNEATHMVKNVLKMVWHSLKMKVEGWIRKLLDGVKNEKVKRELGFVLRTICFTIIGNFVKWILKIPFLIIWKLCLEKTVRSDAEIHRRAFAEPFINANLALYEADALMENLKKATPHTKRRKKKKLPIETDEPALV